MNLTARNWLVVASFVVSVALGLTLGTPRGHSAAAPSARPLIGLSLDTLKEERWQRDKTIFEAKAAEMGADLLVQAANSDDTRQMQDVQALISRHVGVIIIAPHNGAAMAKAVTLAHEAGIPVISYDRLISGADEDLYVSFDTVRIGEMQAQAMLAALKGRRPARIVRIYGAKTDHNSFLMKDGQDKILAPLIAKGEVKVLHEDWAQDWKPENAKKIMNAALTVARRRGIDAGAGEPTTGFTPWRRDPGASERRKASRARSPAFDRAGRGARRRPADRGGDADRDHLQADEPGSRTRALDAAGQDGERPSR